MGPPTGLPPSTRTVKSTVHAPGSVAEPAGMSSGGFAVKTTTFGFGPTAWPVVQVVGQVGVMVGSPSYWLIGPRSVPGGASGSFGLESGSSGKPSLVRLV